MFIAKVIGHVWATQKSRGLEGKKLLLVSRLKISDSKIALSRETLMAVCDKIDAGPGDYVLILDEGGSARSILEDKTAPVRTIVVGIVDQVECGSRIFEMRDGILEERGTR